MALSNREKDYVAQITPHKETNDSIEAAIDKVDDTSASASELDAAADQSAWATLDPEGDDSLTLAEHGAGPTKAVLLSSADGDTFTLPAASGSGAIYTIIVSTTVTSNDHIVECANATDEFLGAVTMIDTDSSDGVSAVAAEDGDGYDTITMNGTTKGGIKGSVIRVIDVAAGHWQLVDSVLLHDGDVASPFSAAVS